MTIRLRGNNYWMWTCVWSGTLFGICAWLLIKRIGFSTDFARVRFICAQGDYRTLLECGAITENPHLPPHLRLDKRSYLDAEDAVISEAPAYDMSVTEKELVVALVDTLPEDRKIDLSATWFGTFNTRSMALPMEDHDRIVKRRIGVSTQPENIERGPGDGGGEDGEGGAVGHY